LKINANHFDVTVIEGLTSIAIGQESMALGQSCIEPNIL
jgi:hypothetical protein